MIRIAIAGAAGRMGRTLVEAVGADRDLTLAGAFEAPSSTAIGQFAAAGIAISADAAANISDTDCTIDFTVPAATVQHVAHAFRLGKAIVIGTTGFSVDERKMIEQATAKIPIVMAPNMAVGVTATFMLAEAAARALGGDFDVEIIESHHRQKADAPSGTALRLGEAVARGLGRNLNEVARHGRHGLVGPRPPAEIGFHAIRGGDIVGEHTVLFAGMGERIEITVRSTSRSTYATGALRAAKFLSGRPPGLYDMFDVLGISRNK